MEEWTKSLHIFGGFSRSFSGSAHQVGHQPNEKVLFHYGIYQLCSCINTLVSHYLTEMIQSFCNSFISFSQEHLNHAWCDSAPCSTLTVLRCWVKQSRTCLNWHVWKRENFYMCVYWHGLCQKNHVIYIGLNLKARLCHFNWRRQINTLHHIFLLNSSPAFEETRPSTRRFHKEMVSHLNRQHPPETLELIVGSARTGFPA